jgi:hypothetical protein
MSRRSETKEDGVGENDATIRTVDADGIAFAAIQGLYQENQQLKRDPCAFDVLLSRADF